MKKNAVIAAVLLLFSSPVMAYENISAGYSIKDRNPFYKMESNKVYAYSNFSSKISLKDIESLSLPSLHIVNYYTAEEVTNILKETFSTSYFDEEYDKLAILERSELNLQTVPTALVNLNKYVADDIQDKSFIKSNLLKELLENLKPEISISKINDKKTITVSYLYKHKDNLISLRTTFLSANDRLYMLTTVSSDNRNFTVDESNNESETYNDDFEPITEQNQTIDNIDNDLDVENIGRADVLPEFLQTIYIEHEKFIKDFKFLTPAVATNKLSYTDNILRRNIELPQNWFYGQINFDEPEASGSLTYTSSLDTLHNFIQEINFNKVLSNINTPIKDINTDLGQQTMVDTSKVLSKIDVFLLTGSIKIKDNDLKEAILTPTADKIKTEIFIKETLQRLKGIDSSYFSFNDYSYRVRFAKDAVNIYIDGKYSFFEDNKFHGTLQLDAKNDIAKILFFIKNDSFHESVYLNDLINQWQF